MIINVIRRAYLLYDALVKDPNVLKEMQDEVLIQLAHELTETVRKNRTVDWDKKESARAFMRREIKRLLRKYHYPPTKADEAVQTVVLQAELMGENIEVSKIEEVENPNQTINTESIFYTVQTGDSLSKIATKYNTTVDNLKKINNLTTNNLSVGQTLLLKTDTTEPNTNIYIVEIGDTLYSIARKFNTTPDALRDLNTLNTNILSIGQQLQIPTSQTVYTVEPNDTLYSIARRFNTSVDNLKEINNLTSNILSIGQQLIIK